MRFSLNLHLRYFVTLSVLFGLLGPSLAAQDEPVPEIFQESIGVELVNIDVVVTDKKGQLVEGLDRDDFTLRIDGTEVPIANFYAVTPAAATARPSPATAPAAAPPAPAAKPLDLVIYLDSFYLTPISRQRVLADLPVFLEEQIAAGARIMLISHVQRPQALTSSFTTDLDELLAAVAKVDETPALGLRQTTERRLIMRGIRGIYQSCLTAFSTPCDDCLRQMINLAENYSLSVIQERRAVVGALSRVVNALSVLEGRKAVLYVSDGVQQQTGLGVFAYIGEDLCPGEQHQFLEYYMRQDVGDLNDLVAQANASRVTFYAVEATGLRNYSAASAEYADNTLVPSPLNDTIRFQNLQGTLHYMSEETGGKAILNANAFARDLGKITDELRTYYSLGYQPEHLGRGISHRVSVKVPKKNHQVRYRRSFLHKKPDQELADKALGAVLFGAEENPLAAEVRVGTQSAGEDGRVTVPLEFSLPRGKLTLVPGEGSRQGLLTVVVAAPGEKRKKIAIRKKQIVVSLPLEESDDPEDFYRFGVTVELEPGEHHLGVGIWDRIAIGGSFLSLRVVAEAPSVDDVGSVTEGG